MKKSVKIFAVFFLFASVLYGASEAPKNKSDAAEQCAAPIKMKVASFNIRFWDIPPRWDEMRDLIAPLIAFHDLDIIGTQEMSVPQRDYILSQMGDRYGSVNACEMNNPKAPRFYLDNMNNFILYRKDKFEVVKQGVFWLGKDPFPAEKKTSGWGPKGQNRFCVWAEFKDKESGRTFFWFNTHLNQLDEGERLESCKLIRKMVPKISGDFPLFITGDFNCFPNSKPIMKLLPMDGARINDARIVCKTKVYGPRFGFHGFTGKSNPASFPIDYIFVSQNTDVLKCGTLTDNLNGVYPSDHFPLVAEVILK